MRYRHKLTGAEIDVNSEIGGDWEPVKAPEAPRKEETSAPKKGKKKDGVRERK